MNENRVIPRVLIVDDEEPNCKMIAGLCNNYGFDCETFLDGIRAIDRVKAFLPDLILLDVMMPGMDGYEVCRKLKEDSETQNIPVIMITALSDRESKIKGLEAGASDFISKPIDATELMVRSTNLIKVKNFEDLIIKHNEILENEVKIRTYEIQDALQNIKTAYLETINRLTIASEYKDEDTALHIRRVSYYCKLLSQTLDMDSNFIEIICYASPMHDVGKIGIPDSILLKPGPLSQKEFDIMKSHTTIGARILGGSDSEFLEAGKTIALTHHERWDGTGYPQGLKEDQIPIMGRIMNIVDQYDSLRSNRPYKSGLSHARTCEIITKGDGRTFPEHFDPKVLAAFNKNHKEFNEIFETKKDELT